MAKKDKDETAALPKGEFVRGNVLQTGKIVHGKHPKLTLEQQAAKANGRLDEDGEIKPSEPTEAEKQGVKVVDTKETLYQGWMSGEAVAGTTGEVVSNRWYQSEPSTEDECFRTLFNYHGSSLKRETFKLDPSNTIDPTKRTYLER